MHLTAEAHTHTFPHSLVASLLLLQLREGSPSSTLWYSSSAAASSSVTGVGASQIPAQYHHMFHYDGPHPHLQHNRYGEYVDQTDPTQTPFGASYSLNTARGGGAEGEEGEGQAEGAEGTEGDAADASNHPPASYMHEGFLHHVPDWMKSETEQRDMAHRGGNTAEDRILAYKRKQERLEREREAQKDAL